MSDPQFKPRFEFVAMMASMMAIVALTIDMILPALSVVGKDIRSQSPADNQLLITMVFLGLGVGQLIFGPLSDSLGRKPVVFAGLTLYVIASIVCLYSRSLEWMVAGRLLQGISVSSPRTISISIVRDSYKGNYMAKVMSFVMAIFILIPVVAPALGKLILDIYSWQAIFYWQLGYVAIIGIWFWIRQPETLNLQNKKRLKLSLFLEGTKEVLKYRVTIIFTFIAALITGSFMVYLSASQHIFENQYGLIEEFPYIFAGLAITAGIAIFLNGSLVLRFGMRKLVFIALLGYCSISLIYVFSFWTQGNPTLPVLLIFMALQFFTIGFLFGNINSIAMEPIGHVAGIGAALVGFFSTLLAVPLAVFIGSFITTTSLPLFIGFSGCGLTALFLFLLLPKRQKPRI